MAIPQTTLHRLAEEQSPWRQAGAVPEHLAPPVPRLLADVLWQRLLNPRLRRFQVILGPRRVGKTTLLYQTVQRLLSHGIPPSRIWWWRLDHPLLTDADLGDLVRLAVDAAPEQPVFVMLDEVVYAPDWDRWLKTFHDEHWPVRIAATASAIGALRRRTAESGVGRWEELHLMPYQFGEFLDLARSQDRSSPEAAAAGQAMEAITVEHSLAETLSALPTGIQPSTPPAEWRRAFLLTGGFPELLLSPGTPTDLTQPARLLESQRVLYGDAVERAIYKDIPQAFGVDNPALLERMVYALAGQIAGIVAPERLARALGISQPTVARYLAYLERSFLVFALPNYSGTEGRIQRRRRKLYFIDGAVRNAALHRGLAPESDADEMGLLQENLVAAALHDLALQSGARLHHWRVDNDEVDLVLADHRGPLAFEIASSLNHPRRGLAALMRSHPEFRGGCYLVAPQAPVLPPTAEEAGTLPLDTLLLAIHGQTRRCLAEE